MNAEQIRPKLYLIPGKEKMLCRRHPWLFSGAFKRLVGTPMEGDLVDVVATNGEWLAVGHYQNESIMVKVLSYDTPVVDEAFWKKRFMSAFSYRSRMGFFKNLAQSNAFRLVNGEGDNMPGLIVDIYAEVVVMQAHSEGMHRMFPLFTEIISNILKENFNISVKAIYDKSFATLKRSDATSQDAFIWGTPVNEYCYLEAGSKLFV
ncbi:MAG: class I SAM-dependent rRNA methyltransferase, partial [Bacteroidales bacterium]|nr:class I SAM-dependent rRNA methyltransferase [Bacteroidales bacterium]